MIVPQTPARLRHANQGFTLPLLLKILGVVAVIIIIILLIRGCIGAAVTNTPTVTLTGPTSIAPNANGTVTVTVTYPAAVAGTVTLKIDLYEDDFGNELLSSVARITIPTGRTTGNATIRLGMADDCKISGASGTGDSEDEHEVFVQITPEGTMPLNTEGTATSANHPIKCQAPQ